MKITVIIPSRGRSLQLLATVGVMRKRESGAHDVTYVIACDDDDKETQGTCQLLMAGDRVKYGVFRRSPSLGGMVNRLAKMVPGDVYCSLCDDVIIETECWDQKIADAVEARPDGVFWWKTPPDRPATYAIVTHKWYEAAGRIFTDYFPFWWDDLWLLETWILASEGPWLHVDAWLSDRPMRTQRMRDLLFWHDFYHAMRPARIADAKRIAAALGWELTGITEPLAEHIGKPSEAFLADAENIEKRQGDVDKPPTPEYLKAKARAESILAEMAA